MKQMFTILYNLSHMLYVISKQQILTHSGQIQLPLRIKIVGYLITSVFYPIALIKKPRHDFGLRLAKCFKQLGPIYIKFGQTLSTRPDLVGCEVTNHLKSLQDKLAPFESIIAKQMIYESFGKSVEELFIFFDNIVIAAASISQVHRAQLKSGQFVAIKILRPSIHHKYNKDIKLLYFIAKFLPLIITEFKKLKLIELVDIFCQTMKFELDLRLEGAAASELADNFHKDLNVYIPKIYWQFTSEYIITTEWIDGISIYDTKKLIEAKLNLSSIAQKFAIMFFNQAHRDGFFHADLHPGNILVRSDGSIALLDFGIMGRLSEKDRLAIAQSLFALFNRDYKLVAYVHLKAGYIPQDTNLDLFAQACRAVTEPITGLPVKDISIGQLLAQLFKITKDFGMEIQPQLFLLQKTIIMVEGVGQLLDTEINMWQLAKPWIKKWAAKNLTPEAKLLRLAKYFITKSLDKI